MRNIVIGLALTVSLGACTAHQTTSGADYLARYDAAKAAAGGAIDAASAEPGKIDQMIREAAAVEPILVLPARLGIARLERGELTVIPPEEAELWVALAENHRELGQFVVINPLITRLSADATGYRHYVCSSDRYTRQVEDIVNGIRIGAARQHVDAVLVYDVTTASNKSNTMLSVLDITIIGGAILPTRAIEAEATATALLLDVRNGYPYGTVSTAVSLDELSPSWGSDRNRDTLRAEAAQKVVEQLVPEVDAMIKDLAAAMTTRKQPTS